MTTRPAPPPAPWEQRLEALQRATRWELVGRAAVAVGTQGWQASLNWQQNGATTAVHLSGPLGVGALVLEKTAAGLSLNGAPPGDAVVGQLQERLGFELPLEHLRFWLLGVPDPATPYDLARNEQDRAEHLVQAGWTVEYDRYLTVNGGLLPGHLAMTREGVRVKVAVDHWSGVE